MNKISLLRANIFVALALQGGMAQKLQPKSALYPRNTLVLGKICKSLRHDCDLDRLPSDIEVRRQIVTLQECSPY